MNNSLAENALYLRIIFYSFLSLAILASWRFIS